MASEFDLPIVGIPKKPVSPAIEQTAALTKTPEEETKSEFDLPIVNKKPADLQVQRIKKEEQIHKTRTNLYRIRYNKNCKDMAAAILNAKYPERKEESNSTKTFTLPIHNWTSHARTAMEYFVTYMLENPQEEKKKIFTDTRPKRDLS